MTETEFHDRADQLYAAIQDGIDDEGLDIDYVESGGVLTLEFENGSKVIFSRQPAMSQVWMAALSGGYHFDYDEGRRVWVCDSGEKEDLTSMFNRIATQQSGETVELNFE